MTEYDNNFTGALFKNDKKESEKHPDYRGSITIDGVEYWQSAWLKKSKSGVTFMSQSFTPKEEAKPKQAKPAQKPAEVFDPFADSEVPF